MRAGASEISTAASDSLSRARGTSGFQSSSNDECTLAGSIERFEGCIATRRVATGNRYRAENSSLRPLSRFCIRASRPRPSESIRPRRTVSALVGPAFTMAVFHRGRSVCRIRAGKTTNLAISRASERTRARARADISHGRRPAAPRRSAHLHFSNFTRSERDISWRATKKNISGRSVYGAFTTARNMDEYFFTEVKPFLFDGGVRNRA